MLKIREEYELPEDWPGDEKIQTLVEMAVPLFIYAATLCRFIGDESWDPSERINLVLEYQAGPVGQPKRSTGNQTSWQTSQLHKTYLPVLNQIITGRDAAETNVLLKEFQEVVDSIVSFAAPLSISSLARLLSVSEITVECRLKALHSVLNVPNDRHTPVRLFHASFRDFLFQERSQFWIDELKSHRVIASKCIQLMSSPNGLKRNICCLRSEGTFRSKIDKAHIESCLSPELQYACLYWVHHITQGGERQLIDGGQSHGFLQEHLLHWLEAVSLLGSLTETLSMIDALAAVVEVENGKDMHRFLHDVRRFILRNQYMIDKAPLQLYYSAITFLPTKSLLREIFDPSKMIQEVRDLPKVLDEWDALLQTLRGHTHIANDVNFSSDGKLPASASSDGTIKMWDAVTGALLQTLGHKLGVVAVKFSPDSKLLASASYDGTVRLWESTRALLEVIGGNEGYMLSGSLVFSAKGEFLVSTSGNHAVKVGSMNGAAAVKKLEGHTDKFTSVVLSPGGKILASASSDFNIRLWDVPTWMPLRTLRGHTGDIAAISFSPDGKLLASFSINYPVYTVKIWDSTTWAELWALVINYDRVSALEFSPDRKYLALGCLEKICLLDADTGTELQIIESQGGGVYSVAFSPDGKHLASSAGDGTIRIWDIMMGVPFSTLRRHEGFINMMELSTDCKYILSSTPYESPPILWDAVSGKVLYTLEGSLNPGRVVVFSLNSEFLAFGDRDGTIKLWHLSSTTADNLIRVWDVATGELLRTLETHARGVRAIAFSPDSRTLVSVSFDATIRLWDTTTWKSLKLEEEMVMGGNPAFSSNGRLLASGSSESRVQLWNATTGAKLRILTAAYHDKYAQVRRVAFSLNDKYLASISEDGCLVNQPRSTKEDGAVRLWDVETGILLQKFPVRYTSRPFLSFLSFPDGQYINTNRQSFRIQPNLLITPGSFEAGQCKIIGLEGEWVTRGGEKLIWLPEAVSYSIAYGNTIALGYLSGLVQVIRFNIDDL
ncbi:hypothetical protein H072_2594 [Dactylellina haptotyla CBS 200.50]|uniref:Uncharacterized protein n=1 Tax=Dactylellina haptotyla (strain CBS 200.50) TaxID=1284197 RepID=S8AKB6_DACHA|nr:hypothetical protein H072_2594 [Dactylellina haptotyla CBS 200.50]